MWPRGWKVAGDSKRMPGKGASGDLEVTRGTGGDFVFSGDFAIVRGGGGGREGRLGKGNFGVVGDFVVV
ncbi:hypothetical protein TIFTF001_004206 [Ficus carica]|uniref:Uncharacterized protein n=1 Tax=Ficus carica TaxID=3494 RepID=A0AA88CST4_FICCA|nr:hypothetical protein TIFTF001_004206 [Ficus carica]